MAKLNGMAHIQLTVSVSASAVAASDMDRSVPFYETLLRAPGMKTIVDSPEFDYCVGGRTDVAICTAEFGRCDTPADQWKPGLHRFCFRTRSRDDVDGIFAVAVGLDTRIIHPAQEDGSAPGYYSVFFEDPNGIRIEANFVPGEGHLEPGVALPFHRRPI